MLRWTSSRSIDHGKRPEATSPAICSMPRSMAARSPAVSRFTRASMRAWASEPWMSKGARRWSKATDALKRCVRASTGSAKRPDHALPGAPPGGSSGCMEAAAVAKCEDVASINQTGTGIRLPNFCNLGVMLRSLLIANVFVVAAALLRSTSPSNALLEFQLLAAFVEPALIVSLLVACAARRFLHSMRYGTALAAIAAFEVLVAWGAWQLGAE